MNKLILPIFIVIIGVAAFFLLTLTLPVETGTPPAEPPMAQIKLADYLEDDMNWEHTSKLLQTLAEVGCVDVNINGFYWDCNPCLNRSRLSRYEDLDELILPYIFEESRPGVSPDPSEQYDLDMIKSWCKRNQKRHSQIKFGSAVRFNAVREITDIFHNQKMEFDLLLPDAEDDEKSVAIKLYEPPLRK
jgi:hypothetical protein